MRYPNIPEEELKNKIAQDYFADFDCTKIIGKVDFCVLPYPKSPQSSKEQSLLWAEAKAGKRDVVAMFAQLILTIGKARTFTQYLPPAFLGAFDAEKIAFVEYDKVQHLFFENDFNWNVAPSDHGTKEFSEIKSLVNDVLEREKHLYAFGKDDKELWFFIKQNLVNASFGGRMDGKIQIDEHNFVSIFHRWQKEVRSLIDFDFEKDKKHRFLDANFFLADLFVDDQNTTTIADDVSVSEDLFVVFRDGKYEIDKDNIDQLYDAVIKIKNTVAYENFWKRYKRPPAKAYQDYILDRKDLLVPPDFRERKGAFFTPRKWVEMSQKYIADVLGKDWQDEYYVWDCAAGTGNLLVGLANPRNVYASTIDQGDVTAMKELNKNTKKLLENHIFQFDFLNDVFFDVVDKKTKEAIVKSKLPQSLQEIILDPEKRKKLVMYINPPYAEAATARTPMGTGKNKTNVAVDSKIYGKYRSEIGKAGNELFAQFLYRIYREIPSSKIANFSKLKPLQGSNFAVFRDKFRAELKKLFLIPSDTFDNVRGKFPIGFFIWDTGKKEMFTKITADVYGCDKNNGQIHFISTKTIGNQYVDVINKWIVRYESTKGTDTIGFLVTRGNDFQNKKFISLTNTNEKHGDRRGIWINRQNLVPMVVYLAVRHCIDNTWINDRDQFLYPKDSWETDREFHNDCLVFALFHSQNRITSKEGTNHWIPFAETEVNAKETFASSFMSDFIKGKIKKTNGNGNIFDPPKVESGTECKFSPQAQDVFDAGRELWKYYHSQKGINVNASLYDIREHFQGRNEKGNMNSKSNDAQYTELIGILREQLNVLADKIAVKVYEYVFLQGD